MAPYCLVHVYRLVLSDGVFASGSGLLSVEAVWVCSLSSGVLSRVLMFLDVAQSVSCDVTLRGNVGMVTSNFVRVV